MALPDGKPKRLVAAVAEQLHAGEYFAAAKLVAVWLGEQVNKKPSPIETKAQADEALTLLLHWCLENDGYEDAALLLWGPTQFDPRPKFCQMVWRGFEQHDFILLMGAGSVSKSFSMAIRLFLEWIRDPDYTTVKVLGPSEDHLESNLFTHIVSLHRNSSIPLPGEIGKLFIGLDPRQRKSSVSGVVIPLGKKAAGRLQGVKRFPRKVAHPKFGKLSRLFIFIDEIANVPAGVWKDIENLITNAAGDHLLKIVGAFNPADQNDAAGVRAEPSFGWANLDPDEHFEWLSTRGWWVIRLDAKYCENVVQQRIVYPGLQTYEGYHLLATQCGGYDSPGFMTMGRGCFPPTGVPMSVIPAGLLTNWKAEIIWYDRPTPCGGVDLALMGGDTAVFVKGSFGLATGYRLPPSLEHPNGQTVMFKNSKGVQVPRYIVLAEALFKLPKGDTVAIKEEVLRIARTFSIRADWLCVDRTGNGQGVYDLLRFEYGEVIGVNYSESASETKIFTEDHAPANELYDRAQTELWFGLRKFIEFHYCKAAPSFPTEDVLPQMTGRRFRVMGKRAKVEKKEDYQSRNSQKSPDETDALTLLVHGVRKASGIVPGMSAENTTAPDLYDEFGDEGDGGVRISHENKFEDL